MKRLASIVTVVVGLSACAAGPSPAAIDSDSRYDTGKMSSIQSQAQRAGLRVIWVNPPYRAKAPS